MWLLFEIALHCSFFCTQDFAAFDEAVESGTTKEFLKLE
jgi:hypothetical protein